MSNYVYQVFSSLSFHYVFEITVVQLKEKMKMVFLMSYDTRKKDTVNIF